MNNTILKGTGKKTRKAIKTEGKVENKLWFEKGKRMRTSKKECNEFEVTKRTCTLSVFHFETNLQWIH